VRVLAAASMGTSFVARTILLCGESVGSCGGREDVVCWCCGEIQYVVSHIEANVLVSWL
jgi:hypothetical protein